MVSGRLVRIAFASPLSDSNIGTSTAAGRLPGITTAGGCGGGSAAQRSLTCASESWRSAIGRLLQGAGPPGRAVGGRGMRCRPPRALIWQAYAAVAAATAASPTVVATAAALPTAVAEREPATAPRGQRAGACDGDRQQAQGEGMNWNFGTLFESVADAIPDSTALVHDDRRRTWREFDARAARLAAAFRDLGLGPDSKVAFYLYNSNEYLETLFATFKLRAVPANVNYRYTEHELSYLLEHSGDDLIFLYTGGTTGMPKAVVWRHEDLFGALAPAAYAFFGLEVPESSEGVGALDRKSTRLNSSHEWISYAV